MRILLDTSILVAAMVEAHPAHEQGLAWLKRVVSGTDKGLMAAHSLIVMTDNGSLGPFLTRRIGRISFPLI